LKIEAFFAKLKRCAHSICKSTNANTKIMIDLTTYQTAIEKLCQQLSVKHLDLVGSAAREDFEPQKSDIDVLIEFQGEQSLFDRYFELKKGLEEIFGRKVDVIQKNAVKNPYVRQSIEQDRFTVYET